MKDGIETRLYVTAPLAEGVAVELDGGQAHYLRSVLRLGPGEAVALFNGRDGEWLARIDGLAKSRATLTAERRTRDQRPEPDLWLAFAPIKRARIDFTAQKAAELGVSVLWPIMTRRTMVDRVNTDRLAANAVEAAEQSERLTVPEVREPTTLDRMIEQWPADRPMLLCDETGAAGGVPGIAEALAAAGPAMRQRAGFVIGPEGGFAEEELDRLRSLPFVTAVGLGPRLLRADTAALAALAVWQAVAGDWRTSTD
ncbi:ribosomal RNA small subunit methyltransferase E [Thalassobaculum fulvum]|uniref:Ribosomal RNA small subunit methyltransferase E n=1 Tax=Thalassobaculum fulvum TaxID=1633335 RepID=A0A918XUG4_9PROT|nr:16S rRNA (uracil(1498)-N(3))-methyltransferase [Thalassobaculum fulvum]GHD57130.1 ribosomal RNA small subunit methyltransferase E [Thalassobaculum fulvum]